MQPALFQGIEQESTRTIPLALQTLVQMNYNKEEMESCEIADTFYNMGEHNEDDLTDTVAQLDETTDTHTQEIARPNVNLSTSSPMPPVPPIPTAPRPRKLRRIDMQGV